MISALLVILLSTSQTITATIPPNTPFQIAFDQDNSNNDNYRLWCDGSIVKNFSSSEVSLGRSSTKNAEGNYTFTLLAPGLPVGIHSCQVSAYNTVVPDDVKSDAANITVGGKSSIPVNFRLIINAIIGK